MFNRHLRRMRELYAARCAALTQALATELPRWEVAGSQAGLDLTAWLPPGLDDRASALRLRGAGIEVQELSSYALRSGARPGLILGFSAFTPRRLKQSVVRMREVLEPGGRT
jgi:GntR family transcriptional regulator/MocR family aminotransferase